MTPTTPTYPPDRHVLRDLRFTTEMGSPDGARAWIEVDEHLRDDQGLTHVGAIATLVDALGGGLAATAALPDWIATADLTLHLLPRADIATIEAAGRVVRAGRTTVVIEADLLGDGEALGVASMTFAVLPRRDGNPVMTPTGEIVRATMALPDSGFVVPLEAAAGIEMVDPAHGVAALPITDYVRNTLGALQGGMVATLAATAAQRALTHAAGTPQHVVDLQVTYLALARVGPVATRTAVLATDPRFGTARVELVDTGADGRVTTVVRARAVRAPGEAGPE